MPPFRWAKTLTYLSRNPFRPIGMRNWNHGTLGGHARKVSGFQIARLSGCRCPTVAARSIGRPTGAAMESYLVTNPRLGRWP